MEGYDDPNVPDDDPDELAPFLDPILATTSVKITLDGRVLLNGTGEQLDPYLIGPTYFDEPIVYATPLPRGGPNAVEALWVLGFGAMFRALPPGEHTLVFDVDTTFPNPYTYTYFITVAPK